MKAILSGIWNGWTYRGLSGLDTTSKVIMYPAMGGAISIVLATGASRTTENSVSHYASRCVKTTGGARKSADIPSVFVGKTR